MQGDEKGGGLNRPPPSFFFGGGGAFVNLNQWRIQGVRVSPSELFPSKFFFFFGGGGLSV